MECERLFLWIIWRIVTLHDINIEMFNLCLDTSIYFIICLPILQIYSALARCPSFSPLCPLVFSGWVWLSSLCWSLHTCSAPIHCNNSLSNIKLLRTLCFCLLVFRLLDFVVMSRLTCPFVSFTCPGSLTPTSRSRPASCLSPCPLLTSTTHLPLIFCVAPINILFSKK